MTAREIIDADALRWTIEPMFGSLKHGIGVKETWQRRRQTLHRWVQILSTAFALTQMMAVYDPARARQLAIVAPWRKERHLLPVWSRGGSPRFSAMSVCWPSGTGNAGNSALRLHRIRSKYATPSEPIATGTKNCGKMAPPKAANA